MADSIANQPVVIDNGTGVLKAGFAGGDRPRVVYQSHVGRPKYVRMIPGGALEGQDVFVGKTVAEHKGAFRVSYPMEHGVVTDWGDMEKVWAHVYARENLNVASEEHPVLLTEAPLNPHSHSEKAAEVFFETFNAPALFCAPQAVLSLYASGRTTGVVLDAGDGVTHAVPVYEGFALPHAVTRVDLGGRDVTRHLQTLLRRLGHNFQTSAELETVRQMKEELCYVAFRPQKEEVHYSYRLYALPDGTALSVGKERFRAPELLFRPGLVGSEAPGIHEVLAGAIFKTDLDLRKTFFGNVVLAGGTTLFQGLGDRLLNEVRKLAPKATKIRIAAPPERLHSTWIGGSILASLATFKTMWVTKAEYEERGAAVVHRRGL
ncbi:unnamed protein product [Heterosigma akashiwo]|mmetsp:Transcript_16874/g.26632  ORF Transcript_16874/g.26632 Transcript_16874/m.26632 type:complete len:376 (-) Transcript_16874:14-1141(-)